MGVNFAGAAYIYTEADVGFDPLLQLKNVDMDIQTWAAKYIRTFELFGKSSRIDLTQGYQEVRWQGLLDGVSASTNREGWSDSFVRLAINLYGSPPLRGKSYATYRAGVDEDTIVGIGLAIRLPSGDYENDKLLNIGANRFTFRPQLGVSHFWGNWITELTSEVALYTDNDEFYDGNKLEQDPLYIIHGHLIYSFRPGLWLSASAGYDYGGETTLNGIAKKDKKQNIGWALSAAYPLSRFIGVKLAYTNIRTLESTGLDADSFMASLSYMW